MSDSNDIRQPDSPDSPDAPDAPDKLAALDRRLAVEAESDLVALRAADELATRTAEYRDQMKQLRKAFPRRRQPGGNDLERQHYLMAQQRLRWYARMGIALELDEDGAPMPYASGTEARLPTDPWSLPTSVPTLKVRDAGTLGRVIRLWRRRINAPVAQVAQDSGQTIRFIGHLERGEGQATLSKILSVTDALDMELLIRPRRSRLRG